MAKVQFSLEFVMGNISQQSLWRMVQQPEGLSEWFADEAILNARDTIMTFRWGNSEEKAIVLEEVSGECIRYRWCSDTEKNYFEFLIHRLDLTGEVALQITDFVYPDEQDNAIALWESQVEVLRRKVGA